MWWNNDHSYVPVQSWYVNINISSFSVASNLQTPALLARLAGGSIAMDTDFAVHTCRLSPKPNVHCLNFIAGTTRRVLHFSLLLLSLLLWFLQLTLVVRLVGIISVNWDTLLGSQVAEKHIVLDSNTGQGPLLHVIPYLPFPNAFFLFLNYWLTNEKLCLVTDNMPLCVMLLLFCSWIVSWVFEQPEFSTDMIHYRINYWTLSDISKEPFTW